MLQNSEEKHSYLENESLNKLNSMVESASWEEKEARRELENIRLEIDNLRSKNTAISGKLNDNQMKLYQLIQDKIKKK